MKLTGPILSLLGLASGAALQPRDAQAFSVVVPVLSLSLTQKVQVPGPLPTSVVPVSIPTSVVRVSVPTSVLPVSIPTSVLPVSIPTSIVKVSLTTVPVPQVTTNLGQLPGEVKSALPTLAFPTHLPTLTDLIGVAEDEAEKVQSSVAAFVSKVLAALGIRF
ncbi:unnamed protein product [Discula destructiva]